ncbi:MAG: restriction endonuclease [Kiloniellaceae bacterium]
MSSSLTAEEFERLVERIYRTLSAKAEVRWNAQIQDDHVPGLRRQIDVLLQDEGKQVIVECRLHNRPQDVQWIEQLSAKRVSVNADSVIAVSGSGFTRAAETKAKALGIFTRSINRVSEDEIASWTNFDRIEVQFMQFSNLQLNVDILRLHRPKIGDPGQVRIDGFPGIVPLLEHCARSAGDSVIRNGPQLLRCDVPPDKITIDSVPAQHCTCRAVISCRRETVNAPVMFRFTDTTDPATESVIVERSNTEQTELITTKNAIRWTADLSKVKAPKNCVFFAMLLSNVSIGGEMGIDPVGAENMSSIGDISCRLNMRFVADELQENH